MNSIQAVLRLSLTKSGVFGFAPKDQASAWLASLCAWLDVEWGRPVGMTPPDPGDPETETGAA